MRERVERIGDATLYLADARDWLASAPACLMFGALITDPPYGVGLGDHLAAKDRRVDRVLVKDGYVSYADTVENYVKTVVPVIRAALGIAERGLVFAVPPVAWELPPPDAMGGVFLPAACGRNKWGWSSLSHALLYGRAPSLELGARPTAIESVANAEKNGHPCPKPLPWMRWAVGIASRPGETVLDPFMGSGTTGVACIQLGRKFMGIEIEPKYFDIACRRIEAAVREPRLELPQPKPKQMNLLDGAA